MAREISITKMYENIKWWVVNTYDRLDSSWYVKLFVYSNILLYTLAWTCWILKLFWVI